MKKSRASLPIMALLDLPLLRRNSSLICVGGKQKGGIHNKGAKGQGPRMDRYKNLGSAVPKYLAAESGPEDL